MKKRNKALTIAGSDPSGGAGLQADLKTFQSLGVYGLSIPSVLTAQNTEGVYTIHELPLDLFSEQMDILLQDIQPDALKTGMLYTLDHIQIIAEMIQKYSLGNFVIDPVTVSSTGVLLTEQGVLEAIKNQLFPHANVITPNIYEASVLVGEEIQDEKDMKNAAVKLRAYGPGSAIITGGHLQEKAVDLLFDGEDFIILEHERLTGEFHGTGCVFSAAVTACLALDYGVREAFVKANEFTFNAMKSADTVGRGMRVLHI